MRIPLSRRGFILTGAAVTGGLVVGFGYKALDDGDATNKFGSQGSAASPLNGWLKITPDGEVICGIHRAEMGQGVTTSLAMLLAEELDADWSRVRFEFTPVDRDYYNFGMLLRGEPLGDPTASWGAATGTWAIRRVFHALGMAMTISSSSVTDAWDTLRPAGASARQMLLQAAAREWQVPVASLQTAEGVVIDPANDRQLDYGALAEAASRETPPDKITLKEASAFKLIGRNPPRLDTPAKVDGTAQFGLDVRLPDMLYAAILHSPVAGTAIASYDAATALEMRGVYGVYEIAAGHSLAVVGTSNWHAQRAAKTVTLEPLLEQPPEGALGLADSSTLIDDYLRMLDDDAIIFTDTVAEAAADDESAPTDFASVLAAGEVVSAEYAVPFLAHACMEPMNCTALFKDNVLDIWAPTQAQSIVRDFAKQWTEQNPPAEINVHMTYMGGGFGRRAELDFALQAVSVARQIPGRPVQVVWSREQDMRHDAFRPAAVARFSGQLTESGKLRALDYTLVTQSVVASYETRTPTPRGGDATTDKSVVEAINPPVYPVEHLRLGFVPADLHVPAGYWRSVAHSWTIFFMESFIDELAVAGGYDPLAFRLQLLESKPRHRHALETVAAATKGSNAPQGYAVAESHGTVVAHAIEVVAVDGRFARVIRVTCAVDCGPVVHPDNVIAQMEGSVVDGLSAALYGDVQFKEGRAIPGNFDSYRRLRMADCPSIDVHIIASKERRPGGTGEPAVPGVAPALCNAIFAATGERMRRLPLQPV